MKFIGHLDMVRYFQKAMRRAQIPAAFTKGYSPHMVMSFAHPLGVGLTSEAEYIDVELKERISSKQAIKQLGQVMAEGVEVFCFVEIAPEKKFSGMTIVAAADYLVPKEALDTVVIDEKMVDAFIGQKEILITKQTKRSEKIVDIKPMIYKLEVVPEGIFMQVATGSKENLKPSLVMEAFFAFMESSLAVGTCFTTEKQSTRCLTYHRKEIYAEVEGALVSLESLGKEIV